MKDHRLVYHSTLGSRVIKKKKCPFPSCPMVHCMRPRKVDIRLPGKGNSKSHGARPVHQIISMIKWIRTRRLSIENSLS